MPIYEYRAAGEAHCDACAGPFEAFQNYSDPPLAACPECGAPVEKLFSTPTVQGAGRTAETLSNKNLAEKGFTKYVKNGKGTYEKVAGKGPKVITK